MFARTGKDLRRLRRILAVLAKYGYGEMIRKSPQLVEAAPDEPEAEVVPEISAPRRFRLMLEELGSTFIKLGQLLSARPDLVSQPYVLELRLLQDSCEPLAFDQIEVALRDGLGQDPANLFKHVDPTPMATASIAQVHRATTIDGADVAVKVQRPGIHDQVRADIDILYRIARILDRVIEESAIAEPVGIIREFDAAVTAELNFEIEAANVREFRRARALTEDVVIPKVYDELSTATVLTLEFLKGVPFSKLPEGVDKKAIAERIVKEAFDEVFVDGLFHADPHPGNLLLLDDGRFGILDFGLCGRMTAQMKETLVVLALAIAVRDADTAARTLYRLGQSDARISISDLRNDISGLFETWLGLSIQDMDSTLLVQELLLLALRHKIRVPPEYTMLGRAGATIEGIVRDFHPEIDVAKVATPYLEQLLIGRVGPDNVQGGLYKLLLQFQGMSQDVPIQLSQILADLSAGNFNVTVRGKDLEKLQQAIVISAAAVCGSILGGAFVVGALVALAQVRWTLLGVPVAAWIGGLAGILVFSWVSAYVVLRPRLKKISVAHLFSKRP